MYCHDYSLKAVHIFNIKRWCFIDWWANIGLLIGVGCFVFSSRLCLGFARFTGFFSGIFGGIIKCLYRFGDAMATFEHLRTKDNFALAFTLATLCDSIRVYPENTEKTRSVGQLLNTFLSMSNEELIAQMTCMSYEHLSSNTGLKGDHNSPVQILLNAHSALPEKESITKAAFVADSDTLNKYTIAQFRKTWQR